MKAVQTLQEEILGMKVILKSQGKQQPQMTLPTYQQGAIPQHSVIFPRTSQFQPSQINPDLI